MSFLPWPWSELYDMWRNVLGSISSMLVRQVSLLLGAFLRCLYYCMACYAAVPDYFFATLLRTQLSIVSVCWSLVDMRGIFHQQGDALVGASEFNGVVAVIVGELSDLTVGVAARIARSGAWAVHLVNPSGGGHSQGANHLRGKSDRGLILTNHRVDFTQPGEVVRWCRSLCQCLSDQGQQVSIAVLSSVVVAPKEQRLTRDALDQAFAADVIALQALLAGLRPVLSPGARVVVTASAACGWLTRIGREALGAGCLEEARCYLG